MDWLFVCSPSVFGTWPSFPAGLEPAPSRRPLLLSHLSDKTPMSRLSVESVAPSVVRYFGRYIVPCSFVALLLLPLTSQAQGLAASVRAGTPGIGADLTLPLSSALNVRAGGTYFAYGTDGTQDLDGTMVGWEGDSDILFLSALADWHPFGNTFRLTGGVVYNGLEVTGSFKPEENVEAGGTVYTPAEIGRVDAVVDYDRTVAPYLGIGVGNPIIGGRVGMLFDIGVIHQGSPNVNLDASEMLTPTEGEAAQIEENISWAQWYPVVSIGVSTRLF